MPPINKVPDQRESGILAALEKSKCLLLVAALCLAFYYPIHTDELVSTAQYARYFLDHHKLVFLFPGCRAGYELPCPLFWLPLRALDALLFQDLSHPLVIRVFGLGAFLSWFAAMTYGLVRQGRRDLVSIFTASLCLGVTPFMMIFHRPEVMLMRGIAFAILLPLLFPGRQDESRLRVFMKATLFLYFCTEFFSSHPKGLFFIPVWLVSAWFSFAPKKLKALATGLIAWNSYLIFSFHQIRTTCPEVRSVEAIILSRGIQIRQYSGLWRLLVSDLVKNAISFGTYLIHLLFHLQFYDGWLPTAARGQEYGLDFPVFAVNWLLFFSLLAICILFVFFVFLKIKADWNARRLSLRGALMGSLFFGLICLSVMQKVKPFYETPFFYSVLLGGFFIGAVEYVRALPAWLWGGLNLLACASLIILLTRFTPYALLQWNKGGYVPYMNRNFSAFEMDKINSEVKALGNQCALGDIKGLDRLIVDDITYSAYYESSRPLYLMYQAEWMAQRDIRSIMREFHSSGLIADCRHVPEYLRTEAKSDGVFCCLPARKQ